MRKLFWALLLILPLTGCGYNEFQARDEQVKAAWSEVVNQYQRRADLIPNLVSTARDTNVMYSLPPIASPAAPGDGSLALHEIVSVALTSREERNITRVPGVPRYQ